MWFNLTLNYFQIEDILKIHEAHSHDMENAKSIQLSIDGVSESKSTNISLDVYSLKFKGCREVYPIKIVRPIHKGLVNHKEQFARVLNAMLEKNLELRELVADNPKRSFVRDSLQHSSTHACEYCFQCGEQLKADDHETNALLKKIDSQRREINLELEKLDINNTVEIDSLKKIINNLCDTEKIVKKRKNSHIVWPATTMNGEERTKENFLDIVEQIESGADLTHSEKKGIKGRSLLLAIDNFDYVLGVTTEYMHLVSLGVTKRLIELCFSVGENRHREIKRPLTHPDKFSDLMKEVKVFKEFSRRARKLDLSVMEAQELRNFVLFYFVLVTKCLGVSDKEIKLWEMFAFMIRACILPEAEFSNVNQNEIKYCQKNFYYSYQSLYGKRNCTYSIHVMGSHLMKMRALGPLTETSAFKFESFYAELRRSFQPGTNSVVKQMFQNVMLKRMLSKHVCEEKIYLREKDTPMECNSIIYTFHNNSHAVYKIKTIDDDILTCNQIGNHPTDLNTSMLNWSSVGVYRKGGLCSEDVIIHRNEVAGKVMKVDKYLITCPVNILREK